MSSTDDSTGSSSPAPVTAPASQAPPTPKAAGAAAPAPKKAAAAKAPKATKAAKPKKDSNRAKPPCKTFLAFCFCEARYARALWFCFFVVYAAINIWVTQTNGRNRVISVATYTVLLLLGVPMLAVASVNWAVELSPFWRTFTFLFEYIVVLLTAGVGMFNILHLALYVSKIDIVDDVVRVMSHRQRTQFFLLLVLLFIMVIGQSFIIYKGLFWLIQNSKESFEREHDAAGRRSNEFYRAFGSQRYTRSKIWHMQHDGPGASSV
eukprot:c39199_g1_i1.p1 GENE.c39199_g1_i1~~c39199_g1_i1.p1  ORF type:complete len:275 (-),score=47.81 c39199_g1_i1:176-967(-)